MKTKKLLGLSALLLALGMVGCGEEKGPDYKTDDNSHWTVDAEGNEVGKEKHTFAAYAGDDEHVPVAAKCNENSVAFEKCETCGYIHQTKTKDALKHDYKKDDAQSKNATCKEDGVLVEICSLCQDKKTTPIAKGAHTITYTENAATADTIKYKTGKCSVCQQNQIVMAATDAKMASGSSNKSGTPDGFIKLNSDGNSMSLAFNATAAGAAKIVFECCMDAWTDSDGNNKTRTFYYTKTDYKEVDTPNMEVKMNDTVVDTSALKGKAYSTIFPSENPVTSDYSGLTMLEIGAVNLQAGLNTITITRKDSFNVIIKNVIITF